MQVSVEHSPQLTNVYRIAVNPQAVNEPGFDVFTANKRAVLYMTHTHTNTPVAFVAIGAMLVRPIRIWGTPYHRESLSDAFAQVGSIRWTGGAQKGATVKRGDELGYFAYGGSTIVALFPKGLMRCAYIYLIGLWRSTHIFLWCRFDDDLIKNAAVPIETLVKVGESLGKTVLPAA